MSKARLSHRQKLHQQEEQQEGRRSDPRETQTHVEANFSPAREFCPRERGGWGGNPVFLRDHTGLCLPALLGLLGRRCAAREFPK